MPSPTEDNGRNERGLFTPGNRFGVGNPYAKRTAELRAGLLDAVTVEDMAAIARKLVELARDGDTIAARILFDRLLGKPLEADLIARIEELEDALAKGEA